MTSKRKSRPAFEDGRLQPRCLQHVEQGFAAAGGVGGDQHPARVGGEEVAQGLRRGVVAGGQR